MEEVLSELRPDGSAKVVCIIPNCLALAFIASIKSSLPTSPAIVSAASFEDSTNNNCNKLYIETLLLSDRRGINDDTKVGEVTLILPSKLSFSVAITAVMSFTNEAIGTTSSYSLEAKIVPLSMSAIK